MCLHNWHMCKIDKLDECVSQQRVHLPSVRISTDSDSLLFRNHSLRFLYGYNFSVCTFVASETAEAAPFVAHINAVIIPVVTALFVVRCNSDQPEESSDSLVSLCITYLDCQADIRCGRYRTG